MSFSGLLTSNVFWTTRIRTWTNKQNLLCYHYTIETSWCFPQKRCKDKRFYEYLPNNF